MDIYILADHEELYEFSDELHKKLEEWAAPKTTATAVYRHDEAEQASLSKREIEVGIELTTNKSQKLKEPLNALYELAKTYECEFCVGIIEEPTEENAERVRRDVCYFGFEEGRPDMFEIASYLEL